MRNQSVFFAALAVMLVALTGVGIAQQNRASTPQADTGKSLPETNTRIDPMAAPKRYYRLDFVLRESDEGKLLNQRTFTMNIAADPPQAEKSKEWSLRSGTRLPVPDSKGMITWVDVGVNLDVRAFDQPNGLQMEITSDISSAATVSANTAPPLRQVKVRSAVMAPLGKPTVVFTADDPASKHQFELQVTPVLQK